jgi:hypothetical protein
MLNSNITALAEDALRSRAPSIFAIDAHTSRSQRFAPIPTIEVLRGLAKEGFVQTGARKCKCRDSDHREFTKHLIRLRRLNDDQSYTANGATFEILLKNANDGSSAYDLMAGLFRSVCLNGLVVGTALHNVRIRHVGAVTDKVVEGSYRLLGEARKALVAPSEWSKQQLNNGEREAFAEAAHLLRFGDATGNVNTPVQPQQLLEPRRSSDSSRDLWTTFNVVQENVIRGGLYAVGRDANNRRRRTTTRPVNGIDQDIKLNKALWVLAERMAEIKTAA